MTRPGIIFFTDGLPAQDLDRFALRLEELAYDFLFVPEFFGREPFTTVSHILARTTTLRVATGIANVYARDAMTTAQCRQTLAELYEERFVLGLGVSHPPMAEAHGVEWLPPLRKMREYLETIESMKVQSPRPKTPSAIWIAAHGPKLLALAAERTDGANTYLMPPEHTRRAREIIGPDARLNVVLPCCLTEDPERARHVARKGLATYLPLPAYRNQWKHWGFDDADFENGGSDRLTDRTVAWGDIGTIRARMAEHEEAGATSIVISPYNPEGRGAHWPLIEAIAG
jgi:probable F420-dependent oxidoreductase